MELAGRVYDIVTRQENLYFDPIRKLVPKPDELEYIYWRRTLRMAALCHDIGHLPFSHAAEKELLPQGTDHETLTWKLIVDGELTQIFRDIKLNPLDVAKLAVGPRKAPKGTQFTEWETILAEIIIGNAFGVDRIDYLLRDAYHSGVAYGRFDYYRLIETLRILPRTQAGSKEAALGIMIGGIHTAEALLLARYFMYTQLYFHSVRRIYDIHLKDFLKAWLPNGLFSTDLDAHMAMTDNEVNAAILANAGNKSSPGHSSASCMAGHHHFHLLYSRNPDDFKVNPEATQTIFDEAVKKFGPDTLRIDRYSEKNSPSLFPVYGDDDRILNSIEVSEVISQVPTVKVEFIYIHPDKLEEAQEWLQTNRETIITNQQKLI